MSNHYPPPQYGYYQQPQWMPPPPPQEKAADLWRIVGIHFGIFMMYQTLLVAIFGELFILLDWIPLGLHALTTIILMIVMFSSGKKMRGFGHLISLGIIIVLGFISMFWIADVVGTPNLHF